MKILYVVDYFQPQLGYCEYFIPKQLRDLDHEVSILTSNYFYPFPNYLETAGKLLGNRKQECGIFDFEGMTLIKQKLRAELFTRAIFFGHEEVLEKIRPDLVIVNKSAGFNVIRMAQLKKKFGYRLLSHDAHLPSGFFAVGNIALKNFFYYLFRKLFANLLNKEVDFFIAVQEDTEIIMRKYYGLKNIVHIPLGTDTKRFTFDKRSKEMIRKENKINLTDFVIIYTGKIIATKGIHILFDAFQKLIVNHSSIHLLIIGAGPNDYLETCFLHVDKQYHKNIHILGFKENKELYKYYSAADIGVWPLEESTAMNDCMACGVPFIANDEVGVKVRLSNNNALLYKKNNSTDLVSKIELLIINKKKLEFLKRNSLNLVKNKLSWLAVVKEYLRYAKL